VKPALGPDEGRISAVEWVPLAQEDGAEGVAVAPGSYSTRSPAIYSTNRSEVSDITHPFNSVLILIVSTECSL
jgi:hypothetical protein